MGKIQEQDVPKKEFCWRAVAKQNVDPICGEIDWILSKKFLTEIKLNEVYVWSDYRLIISAIVLSTFTYYVSQAFSVLYEFYHTTYRLPDFISSHLSWLVNLSDQRQSSRLGQQYHEEEDQHTALHTQTCNMSLITHQFAAF